MDTSLQSEKLKLLTRTALLMALTIALQGIRMPPVFTGPLVNFMLILSTAMVGIRGGTFIGFFTPLIALTLGIIPARPVVIYLFCIQVCCNEIDILIV